MIKTIIRKNVSVFQCQSCFKSLSNTIQRTIIWSGSKQVILSIAEVVQIDDIYTFIRVLHKHKLSFSVSLQSQSSIHIVNSLENKKANSLKKLSLPDWRQVSNFYQAFNRLF